MNETFDTPLIVDICGLKQATEKLDKIKYDFDQSWAPSHTMRPVMSLPLMPFPFAVDHSEGVLVIGWCVLGTIKSCNKRQKK